VLLADEHARVSSGKQIDSSRTIDVGDALFSTTNFGAGSVSLILSKACHLFGCSGSKSAFHCPSPAKRSRAAKEGGVHRPFGLRPHLVASALVERATGGPGRGSQEDLLSSLIIVISFSCWNNTVAPMLPRESGFLKNRPL
jgi:hypothetical protein